jgi:tRNA dimethylallyltransferase
MKELIVITGPTAVGKTDFTIEHAKKWNTEIVSCDSRQFFKELSIGTAKPTDEEMQGIPHHFINSHSILEEYNAGKYEIEAVEKINSLFKAHDKVILTGGSGLYLNAVLFGIDEMPTVPTKIKEQVTSDYKNRGLAFLQSEVKRLDPQFYSEADDQNHTRLIRAVEVMRASGKSFSSFRKNTRQSRPWETKIYVLNRDRKELHDRINLRVDMMIESGLIDEVKSVVKYKNHRALKTVGYQEVFEFLEGSISIERAIDLIKRNTRRYAKRQLTWFRRLDNTTWLYPPFKIDR